MLRPNVQTGGMAFPRVCRISIYIWDLETVPDLGGFAVANDLVGKSDVEVREAIGDKFPKHIYHSIVCIGALMAHREPDQWWAPSVPLMWVRGPRSSSSPPSAIRLQSCKALRLSW